MLWIQFWTIQGKLREFIILHMKSVAATQISVISCTTFSKLKKKKKVFSTPCFKNRTCLKNCISNFKEDSVPSVLQNSLIYVAYVTQKLPSLHQIILPTVGKTEMEMLTFFSQILQQYAETISIVQRSTNESSRDYRLLDRVRDQK